MTDLILLWLNLSIWIGITAMQVGICGIFSNEILCMLAAAVVVCAAVLCLCMRCEQRRACVGHRVWMCFAGCFPKHRLL